MRYSDIIEALKIGREIEFRYKERDYSITNHSGFWYFSDKHEMLSTFDDKETLIKKVSEIQIEGLSIKEMIDGEKYDDSSLYIL